MARSLGGLIADRLAELKRAGLIPDGPVGLRVELQRVGVTLTRQSINNWMRNVARPSSAHMLALLDVLKIPLEEQRDWFKAHARPIEVPTQHGSAA